LSSNFFREEKNTIIDTFINIPYIQSFGTAEKYVPGGLQVNSTHRTGNRTLNSLISVFSLETKINLLNYKISVKFNIKIIKKYKITFKKYNNKFE